MTDAKFVSRHLEDLDDLNTFTSGNPQLDGWLRASARHAEQMRSGRTWVWVRAGAVMAYFTLAGHMIEKASLPSNVGRGSPERIPAILIAKLALHRDLHGQGLGGVLLADASRRIVSASDIVAARMAIVDAIDDDAVRFYVRYGYQPIPGTRRLVRKIGDLAKDIGG